MISFCMILTILHTLHISLNKQMTKTQAGNDKIGMPILTNESKCIVKE